MKNLYPPIALILLMAQMALADVDKDWYPDPLEGIAYPDTPELNWNHKPAGRHGFLQVRGEDLVFEDGTPAKFWGVNIQAYALLKSSKKSIELHSHRLARLGVNLVRFHHFDSSWVKPNVFNNPSINTRSLNPAAMEKLDLWIKCLKDEGIYIWMDFHVGRQVTRDDDISHYDEIAKGKESADLKGFNYYNDDIAGAMREFNRHLLQHRNVHTDIRYRDEPAIAFGLITNENDLTHHYGNALLKNKGVPWHHRSFSGEAKSFAIRHKLDQGKVLETWKMGDSKVYLNWAESRFAKEMIGFLRHQGFRSPIATTSSWGGMGIIGLPALSAGDIIDVHAYSKGSEITKNPLETSGMLHRIAAAQVVGKPLTVSEWNMARFPEETRHQLPTMVASLGALQGWDALLLYGYAQTPLQNLAQGNNWSAYRDPALMALMPAASLLYRQGHLKVAEKNYCLKVSERTFINHKINSENSAAIRTLSETSRVSVALDYRDKFPWLSHDEACLKEDDYRIINDYNKVYIDPPAGSVISDTGELIRNWKKGVRIINSDRSVVVSGKLSNSKPLIVGPVSIDVENRDATIAVQSLDSKDIGVSAKIFITAVSESAPTAAYEGPYKNIKIKGSILIDLDGFYTARSVVSGKSFPIEVEYLGGYVKIDLSKSRSTPWIILEKQREGHSRISPAITEYRRRGLSDNQDNRQVCPV